MQKRSSHCWDERFFVFSNRDLILTLVSICPSDYSTTESEKEK